MFSFSRFLPESRLNAGFLPTLLLSGSGLGRYSPAATGMIYRFCLTESLTRVNIRRDSLILLLRHRSFVQQSGCRAIPEHRTSCKTQITAGSRGHWAEKFANPAGKQARGVEGWAQRSAQHSCEWSMAHLFYVEVGRRSRRRDRRLPL